MVLALRDLPLFCFQKIHFPKLAKRELECVRINNVRTIHILCACIARDFFLSANMYYTLLFKKKRVMLFLTNYIRQIFLLFILKNHLNSQKP